jgi:hypothetical protein
LAVVAFRVKRSPMRHRSNILHDQTSAVQTISTKENHMNKYTVTVENYDGDCKKVTVIASSPCDAMAMAQKNGWYPVDVRLA